MRISISAPLLRLRSDEQLVALFRAGNEDAFRTIHDRYRTRLFAYVRQMLGGSKSDAEDALQDVFLRAYGALRANEREIALRAWLYRVAHNRCIDQLRRPVPQAADVFDVSRTPQVADPSTATEQREELDRLVQDVRRLPEQQRSVLLMREMDGVSYADLADALDVSVPAVKSLLVRARMGLVQAAEARDTACWDVRLDLASAHGRGVRANGRAKRHLRDCAGCRAFRSELRGRQKALAGLSPVAGAGPLSVLAQLVGGSGAAGGGAVAGGGGAMVGGSAAAASKLAIVVGAAVITAGGAVEARSQLDRLGHLRAHPSNLVAAAARQVPTAPAAPVPGTAPRRPFTATRAHATATATPTPTPAHGRHRTALDKAATDPADKRPDIVAPGPTDAVPVVSATNTPTPATTTTTTVTRQVQNAVDSVPRVLPATPPPAQSQAPTTQAPPATTTPPASTGTSSSTTSAGLTGTPSPSGSETSSGLTASGATAGSGAGTATGSASGG